MGREDASAAREKGGVLAIVGSWVEDLPAAERMALLSKCAGKGRVLYVPSLADLKGATIEQGIKALREATKRKAVRVLYRNRVDVAGVTFLGAMFWPSLTLMGTAHSKAIDELVDQLPAYQAIVGAGGGRLRAAEIRNEHARDLMWLKRQLAADPLTPKVVLTNFPPDARSLESPLSLESALHASAAESLVKQSLLWVHGHTRWPVSYRLGRDLEKGWVVGEGPNFPGDASPPVSFIVLKGRIQPAAVL